MLVTDARPGVGCMQTALRQPAAFLHFRRPRRTGMPADQQQRGRNFKTWRIMHTDYRRPLATFPETISAVVASQFYATA